MRRAAAGSGGLVLVQGAAGTGKTALLGMALRDANEFGLRALTARGSELEGEFAFGGVRQLFEVVVATASPRERDAMLAGAARAAELIISPEASPARDGPEPGFAALHAIYWLALNLAMTEPVMMLVDDGHWLDPASLRALAYVAGRISDARVAVVVALRPQEPGAPDALLAELRGQPGSLVLEIGALTAVSVARIVRERLPSADAALCDACHLASGGNPLLLQELLRTLLSEGEPSVSAVRSAVAPSFAEGVTRRVARVSPAAPALARAMSVLGVGGSLTIAAALAGVDRAEATVIAHRLRRVEVLSTEDPFAFVHPLVGRSVYDQLPLGEREAAHLQAAGLLREAGARAEEVAAHFAVVRPHGSVQAAVTMLQAAREALARAAPDGAIRWLERALAEGAEEPTRPVLLAELGLAEMAVRDVSAESHLREALALTDDPALRARLSSALGEILYRAGQWQEGRDLTTAAFRQLGAGAPALAAEVAALWAATTLYDSRLVDEFDRTRHRFESLAEVESWSGKALTATLAAAAAIRGDRVVEVVPRAERALAGGVLTEQGAGAWASAQALCALVCVDEYDRALAWADELAAHARVCGSVIGSVTSLIVRGWVFDRRGDLVAAEAEAGGALEVIAQTGMAMFLSSTAVAVQDAILERSGLDELAALIESTELDPIFLTAWAGAILLGVRGRLRVARGDRAGAVEDLQKVAGTAAQLHFGPTMFAWRSELALALGPAEHDEARELAREEAELAQATGLARPYGVALRAVGLLESGDPGLETLRQSVSVLGETDARLEHARSLVELGAALRRRNRRAEAREWLTAGMERAYRCGAQRLVARARQELHAAGARPRRITRSGVDALTASELRVARLAAGGATNPEIAQELYVTIKTVEAHLSSAYGKLGLSGQGARARLPAVLSGDTNAVSAVDLR